MLNTPQWIIDILKGEPFRCPHCKAKFSAEYIKACGVRISFRDDKTQVLYVEYHCDDCSQQPTLLELHELDFEEFAFIVLEDINSKDMISIKERTNRIDRDPKHRKAKIRAKKRNKSRTAKSKISQREIESVKKFLGSCETHEDFLLALGIIPKDCGRGSENKNQ